MTGAQRAPEPRHASGRQQDYQRAIRAALELRTERAAWLAGDPADSLAHLSDWAGRADAVLAELLRYGSPA